MSAGAEQFNQPRFRHLRLLLRDYRALLGATKSAAHLLILFIPSHEGESEQEINKPTRDSWVDQALETVGKLLGGGSAYDLLKGVWRDDKDDGKLKWDKPVVVHCYYGRRDLHQNIERLRQFLVAMGFELKQRAVGLVIDKHYLDIKIPG